MSVSVIAVLVMVRFFQWEIGFGQVNVEIPIKYKTLSVFVGSMVLFWTVYLIVVFPRTAFMCARKN